MVATDEQSPRTALLDSVGARRREQLGGSLSCFFVHTSLLPPWPPPQEKDAARRNPDLTRYLSAISASGGSPGAGPGGPGGGYADRGPGGYADRGGAAPYGNNGYGGGGGGGSPMLPEIGNAGRGGSGPLSPPQISPPPPPMQPPQQGGYGGFTSPSAAGSRPMSQQPGGMPDGMLGRAPSAGGLQDPARRRKNVLYAVMALVPELDEDDLVYVKREIEQRWVAKKAFLCPCLRPSLHIRMLLVGPDVFQEGALDCDGSSGLREKTTPTVLACMLPVDRHRLTLLFAC